VSTVALLPEEAVAGADRPARLAHRLLRKPLAAICIAYLAAIVGIAIVAPIAMPGVSTEQAGDLTAVHQGPSFEHLLGTDALGRDVLDRLLVGTRVTVLGVGEALVVVLVLGVPLGLAAGYLGGKLDQGVTWLTDLTFSLPAIIIILAVLAVFPGSLLAGMVTLGVIAAPGVARVVRSATLPVREELYIAAARVSGLSRPYIISRHVYPRITGTVIVQAALFAAGALLAQAGLAFLGLVTPPPAPSWGGMILDGVNSIQTQPWLIWPPGIAIGLTVLAFTLLGDSLRDATAETWAPPVRIQARVPRRTRTGADEALTTDALLDVRGLTVVLPRPAGKLVVVDDVSFNIRSGESVGLVGESGCGKTMTAMAILGLLPGDGAVEAGEIVFAGGDLAALSERELRRLRGSKIALVSQEPMVSFDPVFKIGAQLVEVIREHHRVSRHTAGATAVDLLRRVHLPDPDAVAQRYPHELSGGMIQRAALARALAGEPDLLIADEPTTALDVTLQAEILDLIRELRDERKLGILLITHDWGVVADACERVVIMYAGQVVERADIHEIFERPLHPYTEALLASNPHHAVEADDLPTIPGVVPRPGAWPHGCRFHPRCRYATAECLEAPVPMERPAEAREVRCLHHDKVGRIT